MTGHRCRIDTTTDGRFYAGHPGYQVVCDSCGDVGGPQDDARDAQAIANRHEELGGIGLNADAGAFLVVGAGADGQTIGTLEATT